VEGVNDISKSVTKREFTMPRFYSNRGENSLGLKLGSESDWRGSTSG